MGRKLRTVGMVGVIMIVAASAMAQRKRTRPGTPEQPVRSGPSAARPGEKSAEPKAPNLGGATSEAGQPAQPASAVGPAQPVIVECKQSPTPVPAPASLQVNQGRKSAKGLWNWARLFHDIVMVVIFSVLGLIIALFGYTVYHWITPFDLRKELEVDQNTSLGIVAGSIILGLCIIVAAAIMSP